VWNVVLSVLTHSQLMRAACKCAVWPVLLSSSGLTDHKLMYHHISDVLNHKQTQQLSTIYSLRMKRRPHHCKTLETHDWFCLLQKANTKQYTIVTLYIYICRYYHVVWSDLAKKEWKRKMPKVQKDTIILSTSFEGPSFHPWERGPGVVERWICHVDGAGLSPRS